MRLAILITLIAGCAGGVGPESGATHARGKADDPSAGDVGDPFDPSSCPGPSLSQADALALVQNGPVTLGSYQIFTRQQTCENDNGSCGDYEATNSLDTVLGDAQSGTLVLSPDADSWGESPTLQVWSSAGRLAGVCPIRGGGFYCAGLVRVKTNVYGETIENPVIVDGEEPAFLGPVTQGCAFLDAHLRDADLPDLLHYWKPEAVLVASF